MINRGTIQAIGIVMQAAVSPIRTRLYAKRRVQPQKLCTHQFSPNAPCPCGSGLKVKKCHQYYGRVFEHEVK